MKLKDEMIDETDLYREFPEIQFHNVIKWLRTGQIKVHTETSKKYSRSEIVAAAIADGLLFNRV